jgi:hypothetical protein
MKTVIAVLFVIFTATDAFALQTHTGPEGYFVHQFAHVIFAAAMAFVMVVLKRSLGARIVGWRLVRYSALFFLLWNVDAFIGHLASHRMDYAEGYIEGSALHMRDFLAWAYYLTSISEYFFLVTAFLLLAVGLNRLYRHLKEEGVR